MCNYTPSDVYNTSRTNLMYVVHHSGKKTLIITVAKGFSVIAHRPKETHSFPFKSEKNILIF